MIPALTMTDVHKHILRGVSLTLPRGSFTALIGPPASGKSTLLRCAAGLDRPTSGSVMLGDTDLSRLRESRLTKLRLTRMGLVLPAHDLLPALTVAQNVLLPIRQAGRLPLTPAGTRTIQARATEILDRVGLAAKAHSHPAELSADQRRCAKIARALITDPEVLFADEPAGDVLGLLRAAVDTTHTTVLVVTRDRAVAGRADRILTLADGHLAADRPVAAWGPRCRAPSSVRSGRHPASPRSPAPVSCSPY
jgi:putative ABC transport system ATP-binding protein